uniref:AI-2E family transporter n=1 Tax=Trichocoleus desertorum TaxID=1481672 RepID=UPI0025B52746|nr:AI-2E family transporter [Trichocoleus desertorum]
MKLGQWLGLLVLLASVYVVWQIRQLLLLIFTAAVLATAINRLVQQLQRFRWKRGWAVAVSLGLLLLLLAGILGLIVPPFVTQFQELVALLPTGLEQIQQWIDWLEDRLLDPFFPDRLDFDGLLQQLAPAGTNVVQRAIAFFSTSLNALLELLLVFVLMLMFLVDPQPYRHILIRLFPKFYRPRVDHILERCESAIAAWTVGALIEMLFIAALSGIGLWFLQVPLALAHAVLAGLLNFIPNIGPTLSVFLPMLIALLDAPWKAIAVLVLYIVIQQIESYWLTPTIMARQVALLPAITLTAQILFASLFGVLGLLMALPLTVVAKTWIEELLFKDILDQWQEKRG